MKSLFIVLPLLIFLGSCKKNAINGSPMTPGSISHHNASVSLLNPYDSVGIWHNRVLDRVLPQIHSVQDTNLKFISSLVATCNYSPLKINPNTLNQNVKVAIKDASQNYMQLIERGPLSAIARQYLHRLLSVIEDTSIYPNIQAAYSVLKNNIERLQSQVLTDEHLNANDKRAVLEIISVANHSLDYWFHSGTEALSLKKIIRTIATVTGDIGGAIEGYYTGDIVGTASDASAWWYENITWGMPGKLASP
ncbi:MAG: hypothetical protein JST19_06625 [Bacteroidetes bacterium]|nr:hypothetical protein [Bacteroidota bacterium]